MAVDGNGFLTTKELAARWRTSEGGIHTRKLRGNVPRAYRIGRALLWKLSDIESYEAAQVEG